MSTPEANTGTKPVAEQHAFDVPRLEQYLQAHLPGFAGPITDHLDDFTKGIIDTKHLVYYVSFITFGLFLTARSVDTERWRG